MNKEEIFVLIKSCVVAEKYGIKLTEINGYFKGITGKDIPFHEFNFNSLLQFLQEMQNLNHISISNGRILPVFNKNTAHLEELISNQKDKRIKGNKRLKREPLTLYRRSNYKTTVRTALQREPLIKHVTIGKENLTSNDKDQNVDKSKSRPSIYGYTLFGDDFFVKFCDHLEFKTYKVGNDIMSGLCCTGLTLRRACYTLKTRARSPTNLMILLGASDIMREVSVNEMKSQFYELLSIANYVDQIIVCTIPPLPNLHKTGLRWNNLLTFNRIIRESESIFFNVYCIDLFHIACVNDFMDLWAEDIPGVYPTFSDVGHELAFSAFRHFLRQ